MNARHHNAEVKKAITKMFANMDASANGIQSPHATNHGAGELQIPLEALDPLNALLDALTSIGDAVGSVGYSLDIYQAIVDVIPEVTHYDAASISVFEKASGFKIVAFSGHNESWIEEVIIGAGRYIKSKELESALLEAKKPLVFDHFDTDPISANPKARTGYNRMMIFPIQFNTDSWGTLAFHSNVAGSWSEADIAWTGLIGRYCETLIRANREVLDMEQMFIAQAEGHRRKLHEDIIKLLDRNLALRDEDSLAKYNLTERETEVLTLISMGKTNQEIADTLFISISTVKKHVNSTFAKLGMKNRTQAANFAKRIHLDTSRYFRD